MLVSNDASCVYDRVPETPLLQIHWHRAILDEAQRVQSTVSRVSAMGNINTNTNTNTPRHRSQRSICLLFLTVVVLLRLLAVRLSASYRWCVSGTPIGRHGLDDLYGLMLFLQAQPYTEQTYWRKAMQVTNKTGRGEQREQRHVMMRYVAVCCHVVC